MRIRMPETLQPPAKAVLIDIVNGNMVDLFQNDYTYTSTSTADRSFDLHLGNVRPIPSISSLVNRIYQGGQNLSFNVTTQFAFLLDHYRISLISETDSLLISDNHPAETTSISFTIPNDITMENLRVAVDAYARDGDIRRYYGNWRIGIIPAVKEITFPQGKNFVANPFPNNPITVSSIDPNATLNFWAGGDDWWPLQSMAFGNGFLLELQNEVTRTYTHNTRIVTYAETMASGWNHKANPFFVKFYIRDLNFTYNGISYSFAEFYMQNFVLPTAWVLRNGTYIETEYILPAESFMYYVNIPHGDEVDVTYYPFRNNPSINTNKFDWQSTIQAKFSDDDTINDMIKFSVSNFLHNPKLDLLLNNRKQIRIPDNMSFYFHENEVRYGSKSISPFQSTVHNYLDMPFILEIPEIQMIQFNYQNLITNPNYQTVLILEGHQYHLTGNPVVNYMPFDTFINGIIRIGNEHYVKEVDNIEKPLSLKIYPNPFNPIVNISFNLPQTTNVEINIYNIRGQRVTQLANQNFVKGEHLLQWNGNDRNGRKMATGIYFISINPKGSQQVIRKITLMK
jgi:hypothetical protein